MAKSLEKSGSTTNGSLLQRGKECAHVSWMSHDLLSLQAEAGLLPNGELDDTLQVRQSVKAVPQRPTQPITAYFLLSLDRDKAADPRIVNASFYCSAFS